MSACFFAKASKISAACFADIGHSVICVERDRVRLDMLEKGEIPIYEPGLAGIVSANAAFTSTWIACSLRSRLSPCRCTMCPPE